MKYEAEDLVQMAEIAERLGMRPQRVTNWAARYEDFPAPITTLSTGRVWSWSQVKAWYDQGGGAKVA